MARGGGWRGGWSRWRPDTSVPAFCAAVQGRLFSKSRPLTPMGDGGSRGRRGTYMSAGTLPRCSTTGTHARRHPNQLFYAPQERAHARLSAVLAEHVRVHSHLLRSLPARSFAVAQIIDLVSSGAAAASAGAASAAAPGLRTVSDPEALAKELLALPDESPRKHKVCMFWALRPRRRPARASGARQPRREVGCMAGAVRAKALETGPQGRRCLSRRARVAAAAPLAPPMPYLWHGRARRGAGSRQARTHGTTTCAWRQRNPSSARPALSPSVLSPLQSLAMYTVKAGQTTWDAVCAAAGCDAGLAAALNGGAAPAAGAVVFVPTLG